MIHDKNNFLLTTQELLNSTSSQFINYNDINNFQRDNQTMPNLNFNMNYNANFNNKENLNNNFNQKYIIIKILKIHTEVILMKFLIIKIC